MVAYTVREIISAIEAVAPPHLAAGFDNSGLLVGDAAAVVRSALLCVDVTEEVVAEAVETGAGLVISHHPVIFHPLKGLTGANYVQRVVEAAIRNGIVLYAAHTNLDNAPRGLSRRLGEMLGLQRMEVLDPIPGEVDSGVGVVGELPAALHSDEALALVKERLGLEVLRHSEVCIPQVRRVAICSGSGGSHIGHAHRAGADLYLTADLRYNDFMEGNRRMILADAGHFESEYCAIEVLHDIICEKFTTFALHRSVRARNPVNYK